MGTEARSRRIAKLYGSIRGYEGFSLNVDMADPTFPYYADFYMLG